MLHQRLKALLKELHISQRQFAMKINIDPGYFSWIIQGKVNPPDRILLLIENIFQVNRNWLEKGEGEMFIDKGVSLAKKQVLEAIDTLSDEQVYAVSSFIQYLTANTVNNEADHDAPSQTYHHPEIPEK
ncbi:MAG: helix-turn-helix transcriptional regulator [Peptococcaceae bacterium]|jgi:transcriptional regulator with XRE-family HTH domain|nr:helix-turn-helix transcriptional regulator [Peptococcaceae bacterium]